MFQRMLIDITRPIHPGMVIYPNNPGVEFELVQETDEADKNALSRISLGTHTGTHIDTLRHISRRGGGAEAYPLETLIGLAQVLDLTDCTSVVTAADLPATSAPGVLIKTRNSLGQIDVFDHDFVALDESAAKELVRRSVQLVGLDALSIKKRGSSNQVHHILIKAGLVVLEGLWLPEVQAGLYELICLPLKVEGLDGVPVRTVLRK